MPAPNSDRGEDRHPEGLPRTFGAYEGAYKIAPRPNPSTTSYGYDEHNRQTGMTDPSGHTESRSYDAQGRLTTLLTRNDLLTTYEYDADGRLTTETWYAGSSTTDSVVDTQTWSYGDDGYLLSAGNSNGTYTYGYNGQGQLAGVVEPSGVSLSFGYDEYGNRNLVKDSLGGVERSVYDGYGELLSRTLEQGTVTLRIDQTFDAYGELLTQTRYSDAAGTITGGGDDLHV